MEVILNNGFKQKKVSLKEGNLTSIQSKDIKNILKNLVNDYNFIDINTKDLYFIGTTVYDELEKYCDMVDFSLVEDILEVLDLGEDFLEKKINNLSFSETVFLNIVRNLIISNKYVIFNDILSYFDMINQKRMIRLFEFLKEHKYLLIISSKDVNLLYKVADYSIVWNKKFFEIDTTDNIYTNVAMLLDNKLSVPVLSLITYRAKVEKNVKLFYSKDVRDIIKDIYKHV
jgi:ABC-type dipeptide/oligopeptide/nickel transport system ATPase subunit